MTPVGSEGTRNPKNSTRSATREQCGKKKQENQLHNGACVALTTKNKTKITPTAEAAAEAATTTTAANCNSLAEKENNNKQAEQKKQQQQRRCNPTKEGTRRGFLLLLPYFFVVTHTHTHNESTHTYTLSVRRRHVCECSFCLHPHRKPFKCGFLRKLPTRRCQISKGVKERAREREVGRGKERDVSVMSRERETA